MLSAPDVRNRVQDIVEGLFLNIPSGLGSRRKDVRLTYSELKAVLKKGAHWAASNGFGNAADIEDVHASQFGFQRFGFNGAFHVQTPSLVKAASAARQERFCMKAST